MNNTRTRRLALLAGTSAAVLASATVVVAASGQATTAPKIVQFSMARSANAVAINCLKNATASVTVTPGGPVDHMRVVANGLPASTDFDLFVIQVPNAPFGFSWYQGDLETNSSGHADQTYVGRFSIETFTVAPGTAPAPVVHTTPIRDASSNPATAPIHQYHLGLWFNSPTDATKAHCQSTVTPFNGEHTAGVQALSTRGFPNTAGPLKGIHP